MKKLLNFVVILSLAVSFVFAGGSGEESSEDGVVLTLWGSSQTNGCAQNVHTCCVTWCVRAYFFMRHP